MPKAIVALPIVASVLIVGGVVAALWLAGSASGERAKFSSLEVAPQDADVYFAINTDPTSPQWLAVNDSLDAVGAKDPIREAIDEALAEVNLDWEDDITPIAGDEAFFSVPSFEDIEGDSGFVAGFRIADQDKAQEVFGDARESSDADFEEEEYEGVTIYHSGGTSGSSDPDPINDDPVARCERESDSGDEPTDLCAPFFDCWFYDFGPEGEDSEVDLDDNGSPDACDEAFEIEDDYYTEYAFEDGPSDPLGLSQSGAVALVDDVLAIGASPDDVKSVIDVVQGRAPSAAENERLQEFRDAQRDDFLMWGYVNLAEVWDQAEGFAEEAAEATPAPEPTIAPVPSATPPLVPRDDDFAVRSFNSDVVVDSTGSLFVTETITIDYGVASKHGFIRDIPTLVPYNDFNNEVLDIGDVSVTRDGEPEDVGIVRGTPYAELNIGNVDEPVTGVHDYVVQYTVFGGFMVFEPGEEGFYDVSWNVTGDRWAVPIEAASATVTTPTGEIMGYYCNVGIAPTESLNIYLSEGCEEGTYQLQSVPFVADAPITPGNSLGVKVSVEGPIDEFEPVLEERDSFVYDDFVFPSEEPDDPFMLPFDLDTEELFEQLRGTYGRVGFSISSTSDGFALDVTVLHADGFDPEFAFEPRKPFDSHFAESVPAESMFFFAGYDVYNQNYLPIKDYFGDVEFEDGKTMDDYMDDFAEETGLDLEEDILSLLTGEYAVAGDVRDFDDEPEFDILGLFDVNDPAQAQDTIEALGDYLEDSDAFEIDADGDIQSWTDTDDTDDFDDAFGVTVSDGAVIVGYPDSSVEDAVAGYDESLAGSDNWQRTVGLLPEDTTSIGYLSIARILEELSATDDAEEQLEDSTGGEVTLEDLEAFRAVGYATTSRDNGFGVHFVLVMDK